jgi:hypothetical protein
VIASFIDPPLDQAAIDRRISTSRNLISAFSWQTGDVATSLTTRRWFPVHQPQTLQIAVALLYWNAFLSLVIGLLTHGWFGGIGLLATVGEVAGALGIANERKWGYRIAVAVAGLLLVLTFVDGVFAGGLLNLAFQIALVALLLHPMSRAYYKSWFR